MLPFALIRKMFFYKPYNQANLICRLLWCQHLRHSVIERVFLAAKQSYSVCLTWVLSSHSATMSGPRDMLPPTMPSGALLLHLTGYVLLLFYNFRFEVINTKIIYFTVIVWEWLLKQKNVSTFILSSLIKSFLGTMGTRLRTIHCCEKGHSWVWHTVCWFWLEQSITHNGVGSAGIWLHCSSKCIHHPHASRSQLWYCQIQRFCSVSQVCY